MLPTKGEHYSKLGIAQLVEYAHERGIVLSPEFESPGHASAIVRSCPELFACAGSDDDTNVICVGKPGIYETLDCVIGEICELFPHSPYIHIGGDEASIRKWNDCPDCRAYMKAHGISDVHMLYTHFVVNMTNIVLAHDRTPIVWEGFPKEGAEQISRDVIVVSWENYYHYTHELLDEGFRIINACWQPLYITPNKRWTPHDILGWNIYNWQHWWPKSPAHLNPIHVQPTKQVWGAQLCVWEWNYPEEIEYDKENLAALSERTWSVPRFLENEEFDAALASLCPLMDALLRPIDN